MLCCIQLWIYLMTIERWMTMTTRKPATKSRKASTLRVTVRPGSQGMNWIRQEKRAALYLRSRRIMGQGKRLLCTYCLCELVTRQGKKPNTATLDHVIPHALGGPNSADNLVTCCARCNTLRQDKTIREFVAILTELGINPKGCYKRIQAQIKAPIDIKAGKATLAKGSR